jgi:ABC-type Fe3+ transport system permease subunit
MSDYGPPPPPPPPYGAMPPGAGPAGTPPPNYLVWAILSTILCCLPLGVVSIVFAAQVNSKWAAGDLAGAQDSSKKARRFAIWSAIVGLVVAVLYVVVAVVLSVSSTRS